MQSHVRALKGFYAGRNSYARGPITKAASNLGSIRWISRTCGYLPAALVPNQLQGMLCSDYRPTIEIVRATARNKVNAGDKIHAVHASRTESWES